MSSNPTARRALLVLGMHRSGTSALARVLNLLGADLGPSLLPANADNPAGYWEPKEIVALHDELLAALGSSWRNPRPLPEGWPARPEVAPFRARLAAILARDFAEAPLAGFKDPRLCRLVPLWRDLFAESGRAAAFVLTCRHPDEVAASLNARDGMPHAAGRLLWLEHALAAERDTRGARRAFVTYERLLAGPRAETERLAAALDLRAPAAAMQAVESSLDPMLRHQRGAGAALPALLAGVLQAWERAAAGEETDAEFDALRARAGEARALYEPWADALETGRARDEQRLARRSARIAELTARLAETTAAGTPPAGGAGGAAAIPSSPWLERDGTRVTRMPDALEGSPRVSIVIPLFNQVDLTRKCLEALAANTPDGGYEVILVDNGSRDGTPELLAALSGNVKIVVNERNQGFAVACNQGAALAATPNLLFLNNDVEARPGWLPPLLACLDEAADVGVAGSKLLFPDGRLQHAGVALLHRNSRTVPLGAFHVHYGEPADFPPANRRMEMQVVTGACLLVRRRAFEDVQGFDDFFWNGYEDVDLCLKVRERGWRVVYEPGSVLVHHESMSGPERWSRTRSNEALLSSRWFGRVEPDLVEGTDGSRRLADRTPMREWTARGTGTAAPDAVVSIVILARNQLEHTRRCIASLDKHTPEPHELVLVDNGSTDGTREYFESLLGRPNVRVVANASNRGFAAGNNQGFSLARGRRIAVLNNDTILTEGWLGGLADVLDAHPEAGIVGPVTNHASGPQVLPEAKYATLAEMEEFAAARAAEHGGRSAAARRLVGFCWLMRREVLDSIGGFDETFGSGNCEDDDYCLRAHQHGWKTRIATGVFVHHTGSRTFAGEGIDYRASIERNFELFRTKWGMDAAARPDAPYPFDELAAKPRRPRVSLPVLANTHEPRYEARWFQDRAKAAAPIATASGPAAPMTAAPIAAAPIAAAPAPAAREAPAKGGGTARRLTVGVIGTEEPGDGPRALLERHGHRGPVPRWRTTAELASALGGGEGHVLLVGPDCAVPEEALRELMTAAVRVPGLAAVGPVAHAAPAAQRGGSPGVKAAEFERVARKRRARDGGRLADVPHLGAFCLLLDAAAVARAGGLDADLPIEDALLDLFARLRDAGMRVACARGAWVHHAHLDRTEGADYDARPRVAADPVAR